LSQLAALIDDRDGWVDSDITRSPLQLVLYGTRTDGGIKLLDG